MATFKTGFSLVLLAIALYGAALNWSAIVPGIFGRKTSSYVPLVFGLMGALGLALSPWPRLAEFWWIPLLADLGCLPGIAWTLVIRTIDLRGKKTDDKTK